MRVFLIVAFVVTCVVAAPAAIQRRRSTKVAFQAPRGALAKKKAQSKSSAAPATSEQKKASLFAPFGKQQNAKSVRPATKEEAWEEQVKRRKAGLLLLKEGAKLARERAARRTAVDSRLQSSVPLAASAPRPPRSVPSPPNPPSSPTIMSSATTLASTVSELAVAKVELAVAATIQEVTAIPGRTIGAVQAAADDILCKVRAGPREVVDAIRDRMPPPPQ